MKTNRTNQRILLISFFSAFGVGVAASAIYVLAGGSLLLTPLWAEVAFLPGFVAGVYAATLGAGHDLMIVIGCAAVGLAYGLLGLLIAGVGLLIRALVRRPDEVPAAG